MNYLPSAETIAAQNELDYARAALYGPHHSPEEAAAASVAVQTTQERFNTVRQQPPIGDYQTTCAASQAAYNAMNPHKKGV